MNTKIKETLTQQYHLYQQNSIIAIPTLGNNASSADGVKIPAYGFGWSRLKQPLTDAEINEHLDKGNDGIAVKTGNGLAVLDFDDAAFYEDFIALFPYMKDTMINLSGSKHLPHVYFRYPENIWLKKDEVPNLLDLQAEGACIVSNPTEAHGLKYTRLYGHESGIIRLEQVQLEEILQWFKASKSYKTKRELLEDVIIGQYIEDLVDLYYSQRNRRGSRNKGYFYGLLIAQASGQRQEFIDTVRPVFVEDTKGNRESAHSRYAEALRIEASALGYRVRNQNIKDVPQTFAERLCIERYELGGQVLYGLWSLGYGGQDMTVAQILDALKPIIPVTSRSLYSGINLLPAIASLLASYQEIHTLYRVTNFSKDNQNFYHIPEKPDDVELMPLWALLSGKLFRIGAVLDLLASNPGQCTPELLSDRLEMSRRTLQRYLKELRLSGMVDSHECFDVIPLTLRNLLTVMESILADKTVKKNKKGMYQGIWLQDEKDKMYPLNHGLAARLLYEGRQLTLVRQKGNFYQVKHDENS